MIDMSLVEAATILSARRDGPDGRFRGVSIDTRTLEPGMLYVALPGERVDGHDFVAEAARRGAAAALAMRAEGTGLPTLIVSDTRTALGPLAAAWRARFAVPVVGITGSNGKTTVKEMTAAILRTTGPVLATRGNLNNDIGMPLTVFQLAPEHVAAVIEMGANHVGEIAYLADIARPDVAVITNCGPAHLEGFGTIDDVARAKGEIVSALTAHGTAVLNMDDAYFAYWCELAHPRKMISFGLDPKADVTAAWRADAGGSVLDMNIAGVEVQVHLALPGEHNVRNALAASAAAFAAGASVQGIAEGLARAGTVAGRLQTKQVACGARLIDDTYNANPASFNASLEVLGGFGGEAWLVLGDMAELGDRSEALHVEAGLAARKAGVARLFATGPMTAHTVRAFGSGAAHFESRETLAEALDEAMKASMTPVSTGGALTVLLKGSRSMGMEKVVQMLEADLETDDVCKAGA